MCKQEKEVLLKEKEKEEKIIPIIITAEVPPVSTKSCGSDSNNPYLAVGNC